MLWAPTQGEEGGGDESSVGRARRDGRDDGSDGSDDGSGAVGPRGTLWGDSDGLRGDSEAAWSCCSAPSWAVGDFCRGLGKLSHRGTHLGVPESEPSPVSRSSASCRCRQTRSSMAIFCSCACACRRIRASAASCSWRRSCNASISTCRQMEGLRSHASCGARWRPQVRRLAGEMVLGDGSARRPASSSMAHLSAASQ